jgi:hypothetical protein
MKLISTDLGRIAQTHQDSSQDETFNGLLNLLTGSTPSFLENKIDGRRTHSSRQCVAKLQP